jgi:hypothetical protein
MEWNYFFNIGIYKYFISEEIYNQAKKYFYITNDYDKLKKKLQKAGSDIMKEVQDVEDILK